MQNISHIIIEMMNENAFEILAFHIFRVIHTNRFTPFLQMTIYEWQILRLYFNFL